MENKTVDVIIPAYHPGNEFTTLIKRLEKQTVSIHRIIVMNTEESMWNKEWEKLSDVMEIHHLAKSEFDHGGTRAQAAELSDADVMIFMTQDAMPKDDRLIEKLVEPLQGEVAVAYARQLPREDSTSVESYTREFNYPAKSRIKSAADLDSLGIKTFFCSNVCAAYRREIYEELGGFVRHTIFNEDMIYAAKAVEAGYSVAYAADAQVVHSHNYTNGQQFHRNFDLGVSQAEHPEIFAAYPSESEGKRMVKDVTVYLRSNHMSAGLPHFYMQCACKYAGYLLGKNYRRLPKKWVLAFTSNKEYWKQNRKDV